MQTTAKLLVGGIIGLAVIGGAIGALRNMGGSQPLIANNTARPQVKMLVTPYPQAKPPQPGQSNAPAAAQSQADTASPDAVPQLPPLDLNNKAYPDQIKLLNEQLTIMSKDFTIRSKAAKDNPALMTDATWKANIAQDLAQIQTLVQAARTLTPPSDYNGVQGWLNHSANSYEKFIAAYNQGVQNQDPVQLDAGLKAFNDGNSSLRQANNNMEDVLAESQ